MVDDHEYTALAKSDKDLLSEIFSILTARVEGNPYAEDGSYAAEISHLPKGLRAMAATYHLDVSLTLDDIGWHFLNFGEPHLVKETEAGLRELGLVDVAGWFNEAHGIVRQFLKVVERGEVKPSGDENPDWSPCDEYYDWLVISGNRQRMDTLSQLAWDKSKGCSRDASGSFIYESWIKYARLKPENVFSD